MIRIPVQSSNILDVGYDQSRNLLEVGFKGKNGQPGDVGQYAGVPPSEHVALITAPSVGGYLAAHIKGRYHYTKVG